MNIVFHESAPRCLLCAQAVRHYTTEFIAKWDQDEAVLLLIGKLPYNFELVSIDARADFPKQRKLIDTYEDNTCSAVQRRAIRECDRWYLEVRDWELRHSESQP